MADGNGDMEQLERERAVRRLVHGRYKNAQGELIRARLQLARMTAERDYWRDVACQRFELVEIAERLAGLPEVES